MFPRKVSYHMQIKNTQAFTLVETLTAAALAVTIGSAMLMVMVTVRDSLFRNKAMIDLQQEGRRAIARAADQITLSASGKIKLYRCPEGYCMGGMAVFQTPVVTNAKVAGSIYKPSSYADKEIKWGYDSVESNESIVLMVPGPSSPFTLYQGQLIRITRKPYCGDGYCNPPEENTCLSEGCIACPSECSCDDGYCDPSESVSGCPQDCFCGNNTCDDGESTMLCPHDCYCGNGTCDSGEDSDGCLSDCPAAFLDQNRWLDLMLGGGVAFAQQELPDAPDISNYSELTLPGGISNYDVRVLAPDIEAVYFVGYPGPGTSGLETPTVVEIYLKASEPILFGHNTNLVIQTKVHLRNPSL